MAAEDARLGLPELIAASPVLSQPEAVPEQHAKYLKAPPPPYPDRSREMGGEGRVLLQVEVLPDGMPGQARILQSSGYELLDNVARATVQQHWKFSPARRGGNAITQWYMVSIQFLLKEAKYERVIFR